ncbi:hypothetical protein SHL15_8018 [Streptomyces hygroscopicus subsp. limoneus]|nr:hypothetical protein SHL15_8018 [Streptomyces hygroscopicus subsp. limoneus]
MWSHLVVADQRITEISDLLEIPLYDRREALEELVTHELKSALLMEDDEYLAPDSVFFELGLTSLQLSEIKYTLDKVLGCEIEVAQLFNRPTVEQLVSYLSEHVIAEAFADPDEDLHR